MLKCLINTVVRKNLKIRANLVHSIDNFLIFGLLIIIFFFYFFVTFKSVRELKLYKQSTYVVFCFETEFRFISSKN